MTWAEFPNKLKIYLTSLSFLATAIIVWAIWNLFVHPYNYGWIIITVLIILTVPFFAVALSSTNTKNTLIGISDAYFMAIAMIYGIAPCIIASFLHTLAVSLAKRPKVDKYKIIFNISSMTFSAWLYSSIYYLINQENTKIY